MLYTGGILEGASVSDAFANCESARGLVIGSFIALVFTFLLYVHVGCFALVNSANVSTKVLEL